MLYNNIVIQNYVILYYIIYNYMIMYSMLYNYMSKLNYIQIYDFIVLLYILTITYK